MTVAGTLAEGIAGLSSRPDWVILDLMLPDGDGTDVLEAIRDQGLESRVVVTTGSVHHGRVPVMNDLQPDALFIKPVDLFALDQLLRSSRPPQDT